MLQVIGLSPCPQPCRALIKGTETLIHLWVWSNLKTAEQIIIKFDNGEF